MVDISTIPQLGFKIAGFLGCHQQFHLPPTKTYPLRSPDHQIINPPGAASQVNWMGKRLSFTVDLSEVGCGCNAALYMVSMSYSYEVPRGSVGLGGVIYIYMYLCMIYLIYIYVFLERLGVSDWRCCFFFSGFFSWFEWTWWSKQLEASFVGGIQEV